MRNYNGRSPQPHKYSSLESREEFVFVETLLLIGREVRSSPALISMTAEEVIKVYVSDEDIRSGLGSGLPTIDIVRSIRHSSVYEMMSSTTVP